MDGFNPDRPFCIIHIRLASPPNLTFDALDFPGRDMAVFCRSLRQKALRLTEALFQIGKFFLWIHFQSKNSIAIFFDKPKTLGLIFKWWRP